MKTDRPKERDLFSVKNRNTRGLKNKEGVKRKTNAEDIHSKTKKRKKNEESEEFEELITHTPLTYQNIQAGQVILGSILKVLKYEMIVSLPNRMQGHIPLMNISKSYNELFTKISQKEQYSETLYKLEDLFSTGHLIIAKIKSVIQLDNGTSKITLSILPEDVNKELTSSSIFIHSMIQCAVVSEAENGFVMDTGIRNVRAAFLSKESGPEGTIGVGSVFLCAVKKIFNNAKKDEDGLGISLTANPTFMNSPLELSDNPNISSVVPGTILNATVNKITPEGLELSVKGFLGFVTKNHLKSYITTQKAYQMGQVVQARVLYVEDVTSHINCTLNDKMCSESVLKGECSSHSVGDVCETKVLRKSHEGIHAQLPDECFGLFPADKHKYVKKSFMKRLNEESTLIGRVRHIHLIDQLYMLSIEDEESKKRDVYVGKNVTVKIAEHTENGALAAIVGTSRIAFVSKLHFVEPNPINPEEVCVLLEKYSGRVLKYSPKTGEVEVTLRPELVDIDLPLVTEYSESCVGNVTVGFIIKKYSKGILVQFFGGTKALVPIHQIPEHKRNKYREHFQIGSVVKCKVTSFDESEKKFTASLFLIKDHKKQIDLSQLYDIENNSDSIVKLSKVYSIENDLIKVSSDGFKKEASVPLCHLSDDLELSRTLFALLKEGNQFQNAAVFSQDDSGFKLSLKPYVYRYLKNTSYEPIKSGSIYPAVITDILEDKITVSTCRLKSKFQIKRKFILKEKFDSLVNVGLEIGQTLMIKCIRAEKNKPLKFVAFLSAIMPNSRTSGVQLLYDTLHTELQIKKTLCGLKDANFCAIDIGSNYEGKVLCANLAGAYVRIAELNMDGVIHPSHFLNGVPKMKEVLQLRVLNINVKEMCLELTAKQDINKYFNSDTHDVKPGQHCTCEILLAKMEYIIGRLDTVCEGQIVYLPSRRHINDFKGRYSFYEVGRKYEVVIEHVCEAFVLANLKEHAEGEFLGIDEDCPGFIFHELNPAFKPDKLIPDERRLTYHDFLNKAKNRIKTVNRHREINKKYKEITDKWEKLQTDDIPQFDEEAYWEIISKKRQERKKTRKQKFGKIKVRKGTMQTGSTENLQKDKCREKKKMSKTKEEDCESNYNSNSKRQKTISEENEMMEEEEEEEGTEVDTNVSANFLEVNSSGFDWSGQILNQTAEGEESSSDEEEEPPEKDRKSIKRLNKFEKSSNLKAEERKTRKLELERLEQGREPETALDFEEKIERNPYSSSSWIEYVSFHLENAETERARAVAERGLKMIPATKAEERLALWNVALRLEVMYGSVDTRKKAFSEAVVVNDEVKIYFIMIGIYISANKFREAEELIRKVTKKHSLNRDVWMQAFMACFKAGKINEARTMLDRSLVSLPKPDHVEVINRFAQLELKHGEVERGKTLFEKLLSNFPKRLDIWNVYADLLLKQNDIEGARHVLERITGQKLKMQAMKSAFKKLLEFEKRYGTPQMIEDVKTRVEEYVTAALKEGE